MKIQINKPLKILLLCSIQRGYIETEELSDLLKTSLSKFSKPTPEEAARFCREFLRECRENDDTDLPL